MPEIQGEILVIDDNPDVLSLTKAILVEKGYKVRVANSGQRGLSSCRLSPPDMILLDLHLPDLTGYEVCKTLKEEEGTQNIPVVFVSASNETIDKVQGLALGAVDFITKPFQEAELLARISTHLTINHLQTQLQNFNQELEQRVAQQTQELSRVYRASQALTEELMFHPLLCKIVQSACEGCEAPKGMLVLKEGEQFSVGAAYEQGHDPEVELRTVSRKSPLDLPWSVVKQVDRNQKPLLFSLQDNQDGLGKDPYIKKHQPAQLVCLPIRYKDEGVGVLTLEFQGNEQTFGARDMRFLQALLAQGAISLGHARLFQTVKDNEASLRVLLESAPDAILVLDVDRMKFCEVNRQATTLFGLAEEALLRQGPLDLSPPTQENDVPSQELAQRYLERVSQGETVQFEWNHQDPTGRIFPCEVRLVQLPHEGANLVRASIMDISARKQAEKDLRTKDTQLRHMQKLESLGTMAGGIAHDFNNILTAVIGYTHLLNKHTAANDHNKEYIKAILSAGNRAKDLIRQMLIFCRQTEPEPEPVFLDRVLKETITLLRGSLPSTIEIRSVVGPCGKPIWADPTQIQQVLLNLGNNAGHAMREKGGILEMGLEAVVLNSERAQELNVESGLFYRLWVKDNGHGIAPENQVKIFDPFFTTKNPQEGTGLGLSVTHSIVVRHSGAITVDSTPDVGTTFEIVLPVYMDTQAEEMLTSPGLSVIQTLPQTTGRILFVEDEPSLSYFGKEILMSLGYTVDIPSNGEEALEMFRSRPTYYDAVITDLTMPRMTGEVLAKHLLELRPDLPIILCTGFSPNMTEEKAKEMGIQGFLKKPYYPGQLVYTLQKLLAETQASPQPSADE